MKLLFFILMNLTWCLPMSVVGLFISLIFLVFKQIKFLQFDNYSLEFKIIDDSIFYKLFCEKMGMAGLTLGACVFYKPGYIENGKVCLPERIKKHEENGHVFDQYKFGPFYILIYLFHFLILLIYYKNFQLAYRNIIWEKRAYSIEEK